MKLKLSIFTKLFIVIVAAAVLVNLLIGAYFGSRFQFNRRDSFHKNLDAYAHYLIEDLGSPPDMRRGLLLSEKTSMHVAVTGKGVRWSTAPVPPPPPLRGGDIHPTRHGSFGWHKGMFFYMTEHNGYRYHFWAMRDDIPGRMDAHLYLFLGLITVVMAAAYLLIRRLLKPITFLSRGVRETSSGNLDHRIPVTSYDELGSLSASFNTMNEMVARMLKSREQLLLDVSHELRSPLTRIKVALEFLPPGQARESVREDVTVIDAMVGEMLESQRLDHLEGRIVRTDVDLPAMIGEVVKEFSIPEDRVVLGFPETPLFVSGDRERLKTVMRNIIGNALKYSPHEAGPVSIEGMNEGGNIRVTVSDHGPGIPPDEMSSVFEPFYRIDRSRSRGTGGYGLGLHICKKIMEAHGGTIAIESPPERGTTVIIRFKKRVPET